jgi:hypothetical protein
LAHDILGGTPAFPGWDDIKTGNDPWDAVDPSRIEWWSEVQGLPTENLLYVPVSKPLLHSSVDDALIKLVEHYEETVRDEVDGHSVVLFDDIDQYPAGRY